LADMTTGKCLTFCKSKRMQWAGIEYSVKCYCGSDLVNGASLNKTAECNMPCGGLPCTMCGGPNRLLLYKDSSLAYTLIKTGNYAKQGCIQEVGGRALTGASYVDSKAMTVECCATFCAKDGFAFAGLEYALECYCGNTLSNMRNCPLFSTQCMMLCSGNINENCGEAECDIAVLDTVK
jgi:hypothetical protein